MLTTVLHWLSKKILYKGGEGVARLLQTIRVVHMEAYVQNEMLLVLKVSRDLNFVLLLQTNRAPHLDLGFYSDCVLKPIGICSGPSGHLCF